MSRTVILTRDDKIRLNNLTQIVQEVTGVLLYKERKDDDKRVKKVCPVDYSFILGIGDAGHSELVPERIEILNKFLRVNYDYKYIRFHTHTKHTIKKYGEYYATHFSDADIGIYEEELKHNKDFMAMLVTPVKKVLWAPDNPKLMVLSCFHDHDLNSEAVECSLKRIASNQGYDLSRLEGTIRKI